MSKYNVLLHYMSSLPCCIIIDTTHRITNSSSCGSWHSFRREKDASRLFSFSCQLYGSGLSVSAPCTFINHFSVKSNILYLLSIPANIKALEVVLILVQWQNRTHQAGCHYYHFAFTRIRKTMNDLFPGIHLSFSFTFCIQ